MPVQEVSLSDGEKISAIDSSDSKDTDSEDEIKIMLTIPKGE